MSAEPVAGRDKRWSSLRVDRVPEQTIAETISGHLAIYLGPYTAKTAVKTFSQKAFGRGPDTLTREDIAKLLTALRPMLRTLIGAAQCEVVLTKIQQELGE